MKEVKYPSSRKWLIKSRGSHSQKTVGKWIGRKYNSVSDYEIGYVKPPKLAVALLANLSNADPLQEEDFPFYDPEYIQYLRKVIIAAGQSAVDFKNAMWGKIINARKFREIERPTNASKMIETCSISLKSRIEAEVDSLKDIQEYKFMLLIAYGEQIGCMTLLLPRELVINTVVPIYSKMTKLANEIENILHKPNLLSMQKDLFNSVDGYSPIFSVLAFTNCWLAAAYFVGKNYDKAIDYQEKALPLCGFDMNLLAETHRGLLLSLAHKRRVDEANEEIEKIQALLGEKIDDPVDIDSLKCAIAEAKVLIGDHGAREVLAEVEGSIYRSIRFLPLKRIQYYKTKLFIEKSNLMKNRKIDRKYIKDITGEGTSLAHLYGLKRHRNEIAKIGCRLIDIEEHILLADIDLANRPRLTKIYNDMQKNKADEKNRSLN